MDVIINVNGMNCSHCEKTIKDAVEALENVNHVEIYRQHGKVKIDYNQEKLTLEKICEVIEDQGYDVDR